MRVVLDASAKSSAPDRSLNECLHEGVNLLPNLVGVILRFRLYAHACTADIEKAFLQLRVHEADRDSLRFLWFSENLSHKWPTTQPVSYRMARVPFGVTSSPFLLCASIQYHLKRYANSSVSGIISENIYMDDLLVSVPSKVELDAVFNESKSIFADMTMNLTKWHTNSVVHESCSQQPCSILGMRWNPNSDELSFQNTCANRCVVTKRHLASIVCSFWDPMGYLCPYVLNFKLILQDVWKMKLGWDDELPLAMRDQISTLVRDATQLNSVDIPRVLPPDGLLDSSSLYVFSDASARAYGACVYMAHDSSSSQLVMAKLRLAPIKGLTIPHLELMGSLIASRLVSFVLSELRLPLPVKAFCDSKVVLHWICNASKTWKAYVQRTVEEIRKYVPPECTMFLLRSILLTSSLRRVV
jgi:hypothetical protein